MPRLGTLMGVDLVHLASGVGQSAFNLFAPSEDYGVYFQPTAIIGTYHIFAPVNKTGDVFAWKTEKLVSSVICAAYAGLKKAYKIVNPTTSGSFSTGATAFTQTANATISLTFTGTSISLNSYTDNRGGMWRFVVDGGANIDISVWRTTACVLKQIIADGLTYSSHTVVGTFIGDDPAHVPSGGAGTSRGWICLDSSTTGANFQYKGFYYQNYQDFNFLFGPGDSFVYDIAAKDWSIIEYAFSVKKKNSAVAVAWIPDHAAVATKFANQSTDQILTLDNVALSMLTNVAGYAVKCSEIKYIQNVIGFNTNEQAENLLSIAETMTFNYKGIVSDHIITVLQDLDSAVSYGAMLPIKHANFDNSICDKVEFATIKTDNSVQIINADPTKFKYSVATNKAGSGDALKIIYGMELQTGANLLKSVNMTFTSSAVHKLYTVLAGIEVIPANTVYAYKAAFFVNKIDNAYTYAASKLLS